MLCRKTAESANNRVFRAMKLLLLLSINFFLVEVHSQPTFPYVSFMGQTLANHSYVDLSLVGNYYSVQCHTDLYTCCISGYGIHIGDWHFPNADRLPFSVGDVDIYEHRGSQRVDLQRRNSATSPVGIYRCVIPTTAVYDENDTSVRDTVYVGLYTSSRGDISIAEDITMTENSDLNGPNPQFTLTCISTGGPATTVTWTRDSTTVTQGTLTVLNDPETAQYTHTLTVTTAGEYTCTVANNKPSSASARINTSTSLPTNVTAAQNGPTSILVSWSPSSDATGYRIHYDSQSLPVDGGRHILTNLHNGDTYYISLEAISQQRLPSKTPLMAVGLVPDPPFLSSHPTPGTTYIDISGTVPSGSVMTGYYVMWYRDTSVGCSHLNNTTLRMDEQTIVTRVTNLEEGNRYTIAVKSFNLAGVSSESSNNITIMTQESVPSGPPTSVRNGTITPTSITVKWDEVPCLHRNGRITGYTVHVGSSGQNDRMLNVGNVRETTISELTPSTEYTVQVAAVNSIGRGPFSNGHVYLTDDGLTISVSYTSTTSLGIVWSLEEGTTAAKSTISYSQTDTDCFTASSTITTSDTAYNLTGLEEHTRYFITVNAMIPDGGTRVDSISAFTMSAAPSASPTSVEVSVVNSTAITVQWGSVDCRHRNGEITGYRVRYGEVGVGEGDRTAVQMVSGDSTGGSTTISGLTKETVYTVQVAAETSAGTGVYSVPRDVQTPASVYLSLNGDIIPNHGYVDISDVGSTDDTALLCHTDRLPPPSSPHSGGDWFGPNFIRVSDFHTPGFVRNRAPMLVRLLRDDSHATEGMYRCVVPDSSETGQTVYVGLYDYGGGDIVVSIIVLTVDSDLNGPNPQFTLTCISTGGPATTVTWTRDSTTVTTGTQTVLDDPVTAQYTHTLTVTKRLGGLYACTVANSKPSKSSASLRVKVASAPANVTAVQDGPTSVTVTWTPLSPLGDTTGYRISFTGGGSSGSVDVDDGSTKVYLPNSLVTDSISVVGLSPHLPSDPVVRKVTLYRPLKVSVSSIAATSISLSWSVSSGRVASWEVVWRPTDRGTESTSGPLSGTTYTILQLDPSTIYTLTVRPITTDVAGTTHSLPLIVSTAIADACQRDSNTNNVIAITGASVVSVVVVIIIALIIRVLVILVSKQCGRCSKETALDPKTSRNEAYGTVKNTGESDGVYETIPLQTPPPPPPLPQPAPGD